MSLVADTHVHLYQGFPLDSVFAHAVRNLDAGPGDHAGIMLTEREGEHRFRELAAGDMALPPGFAVEPSADGESLWLMNSQGQRLLVVPGRQCVSAERIEVLCLTRDLDLPDGVPIPELLNQIRAPGGMPVLPWSPGKWMGSRGRQVRALIAAATPGDLLVGDTAMRPRMAAAPAAMRLAASRGIRCLAGTDPLPLPGDEAIIGRYATVLEFDPNRPLPTLRATLANPSLPLSSVGHRGPMLQSIRRWTALRIQTS